ncbi:MAG: DUF4157 domain-containing protein [Chloroflexi bacterium]|nr:DUF4157 domain-containing protein [Chloroflexota bacterium]
MSKEQPTQSNENKQRKPKPKPLEGMPVQEQSPGEYANPVAIQRAIANPRQAKPAAVQGVHRAYGNQFVQRLATEYTQSAKPRRAANGKNGKTAVQTKLSVNDPEDQFEKEADTVADTLPTSDATADTPNDSAQRTPSTTVETQNLASPTASQAKVKTQNLASLQSNQRPNPQRSLTVNSPGDQFEQEADAVAESVGSTPEHIPPHANMDNDKSAQRKSAQPDMASNGNGHSDFAKPVRRGVPNQLKGTLFQKSASTNKQTAVSRQSTPDSKPDQETEAVSDDLNSLPEHAPPVGTMGNGDVNRATIPGYDTTSGDVEGNVEQQIDSKRGSGTALPTPVQRKMEGHLGSDFSQVKVHTDGESDTLNRSLDAEAFTTGNDVFFRNGRYQPNTQSGQKLIAHELTHVVQQGAAKPKPVNRKVENSQQSTVNSQQLTNNGQQSSGNGLQKSISDAHSLANSAPNHSMRKVMRQVVSRSVGTPDIQRGKGDKERKKAEARAKRGREVVDNRKGDKSGDRDNAKNKADGSAEGSGKESTFKREIPAPKFPPKKAESMDSKDKVKEDDLEQVDVGGEDLGGFGWLDTKAEALPDWDTETGKYDAFRDGDFEKMGLDLSGLEGDTTGIEVDEEARKQMVMDALSGGPGGDGDFLGPHNMTMGYISDAIPFGGNNALGDEFYSKGPKEWFGSTKDAFKKNFKDIGDGFGGIFESGASGWARAASAIELIISILELVKNVINVLRIIFDILYIVAKIFAAMAKIPFIGYMFKWAVPIVNAVTAVFSPMGVAVIQIDLIVRMLRPIAIAFRVIDMLYYESDPDKLMDRQAKLLRHTKGMQGAAKNNTKDGISDKYKEERQAEDMLIGAEDMEDPRVSPFTIENAAAMEEGDKADYKQKFLAQYGIPDVSDLAIERLESRKDELPPPPLAEYGAVPENDVRKRLDGNAVAIMHLRKQRLGIETQQQEADMAIEVADNQKQIFQKQRDVVEDNKKAMEPHKQDIQEKQSKQEDLKGVTSEKNKESGESKNKGVELKGMAGVIIKFIQIFMGPLQKAGQSTNDDQKNKLKEGPSQQVETSNSSVDATKKGMVEADTRKQNTLKAEAEAKESEGTLDETDQFLTEKQDEAQEGIDQLQAEKDAMDETKSTLESEEERLSADRTEAINDAVDWMGEWRATREEIFADIEAELKQHYKENQDEDEKDDKDKKEGESEDDEFGEWSVYDKQEDMDDLEGEYLSDDFDKDDAEDDEFDF